jgi:hypothetical protein
MTYNWSCPHCGRETTVTDNDIATSDLDLFIKNKQGPRRASLVFIVCPNSKCKDIALHARYSRLKNMGTAVSPNWQEDETLTSWTLIPRSKGKIFPDYIPLALRQDYEEARAIEESSPKASATLARRCLQGMIRDFWCVSAPNLKAEIEAIKSKIDPLTWDAIDAVRKIGNIGAHMERDIDLIVDVEPEEASLLISLIETLIKDWYINREERRKQLEAIKEVSAAKEVAKKPMKS